MAIGKEAGAPLEGVPGLPVLTGPAILSPATAAEHPPPFRAAVRFFVAVFFSLYGDWLTTVALVVVLFEVTHNPAGPAGYVLARVAPRVFGPWVGGGLADRMPPRRIMVLASLLQGIFTLSLVASHRALALWAIYAAVAIAQFAGALARPAQGAMLPSLVSSAQLPRANATYFLFFSSSVFVGPAIGAALLVRTGADLLFILDAATFVIAAALTMTLPDSPEAAVAEGQAERSGASRGTLAGVKVALRDPVIRMIAAANLATGVSVTVTQALLVVAAQERFGSDAAVGYLYAGVGIGGTLGGLIALQWRPPRRLVRTAVAAALAGELLALAGFSLTATLMAAVLVLAASSAMGSSFDTWGATEVQRRALPGYMGRFNSVIPISMFAGMLVGALWALGTSSLLHWDRAVESACGAMLVLIFATWASGRTAQPELDTQKP